MPSLPNFYTDFHGGFDTKDQPFLLSDDTARDVANLQATRAGAMVKRAGLQTFASPAGVVTSLRSFESVTPLRLVGALGTTLIAIDPTGVISTIKTGLAAARWDFAQALNAAGVPMIFGINGVDPAQQWDGAAGTTSNWTNTSGSSPVPNGKYLVYANNQIYIAGVANAPSRVYWSAIANPNNWDPSSNLGAGFQDFDPGDGQVITAIGRVGPYVMVCKPRKTFIIIDPTTATTRRLSDNVGCIAHRSIATGPEGTYFLSEDRGVYQTNGSALDPISDSIQPTIDLGAANAASAAGACFGGHYYLSMALSGVGGNDTTLDYDSILQSWWKHTFGASQFTVWHPANVPQLMQAKGNEAGIDQCFAPGVTVDNGVPFTWVWRGPWQSPSWSAAHRRVSPMPYYRKRLRQMRIIGTGTIDFSMARDFADDESLIRSDILFSPYSVPLQWADATINWADPSAQWAQGALLRQGRVYSLGVSNAFSIVFSATSHTQDEVTSYTLFMVDRKDLMP